MKNHLLIVAALVLCAAAYSQNNKTDWRADLDRLATELPAKHRDLFALKSRQYFLDGIERLKRQSDRAGDFQTALRTQQLIASMGDSHTSLDISPLIGAGGILPLQIFWTSDGLHVTATDSENSDILGHRLVSIGGAPVERVFDSLSTLFTVDNRATVRLMAPRYLPSLRLLEYFGFATPAHAEMELEANDGSVSVRTMKPFVPDPRSMVAVRPDSVSFCKARERLLFTARWFPDERIYYIL